MSEDSPKRPRSPDSLIIEYPEIPVIPRIGNEYQVDLPCMVVVDRKTIDVREDHLIWMPNSIPDVNLLCYLKAARSLAAFAGMCERGQQEDMYDAASKDDTTINALEILHKSKYDVQEALETLVQCPLLYARRPFTEDEQKKFAKGVRLCGKNFFRICKEFQFFNRHTNELVEFYYFWKKTPIGVQQRPKRKTRSAAKRNQNSKAAVKNNKSNNSENTKPAEKTTTTSTKSTKKKYEPSETAPRAKRVKKKKE
ncbi:hypothetical protein SNEBB_009956 [Seison nebaliae]|nr:hypothetical protein SNEBB_009956 [Seison nebaliae]